MSDIILKKVGESYMLSLPNIWNGWYLVNGQQADGIINLIEEPYSIVKVEKRKVIDYFKNETSQISIEEYNKLLADFRSKGYEDNGEWYFADIEDEIRIKRFIQEWSSVYKEELIKTPLTWKVFEYPESKNKYICSYRTIGKGLEPIFNYSPNPIAMLREIAKEFGFEEVPDQTFNNNTKGKKFSISSHSGIEYAKFNNKYLFTGNNKIGFFGITGTYEECEERFKQDWNKLYNKVKEAYVLLNDDPLSDIKTTWVLNFIKEVKNRINKIDSNKKTYDEYRYLTKYILESESEFLKFYNNKNVQDQS